MTSIEAPQKLRKAPIFTPYVVMWSTMGALSLGLLAVLGLAPEWLADFRPAAGISDPQSNQGQRAAARLAADMTAVKQGLAQVQLDLANVKTEMATNAEQQKAVSAQLTALEGRVAPAPVAAAHDTPVTPEQTIAAVEAAPSPAGAPLDQTIRGYATGSVAAAPKATASPATQLAAAPTVVATTLVPSQQPLTPAATPKIINADTTAGTAVLETGSVASVTAASALVTAKPPAQAQAISFGPATVKPAPKPVGIKVSTGDSVDSLRLSWSLLSEKHGDALKSLQPRVVVSGDPQNPTYDLVAGPVKSKSEANRVCKTLTAQGVPCTVGAFAGDSL